MARTKFSTGKHKDIFLYRTQVENLFINEFLPDAPGDFVKVFLFGLMYAQYGEEIDSRKLALTLGMTETDVDNAWKYWEANGLVVINGSQENDDFSIEFVRQIDLFYGKTIEESYPVEEKIEPAEPEIQSEEDSDTEESAAAIIERLMNQQLREIFEKYQTATGRTLSRREAAKLTDAVKVYEIEPDVLDFAITYCTDIDKYSVDYIFKVALRWKEEGCKDVAQVKVMLDKHSRRNEFYRQTFGALGWNRIPTPAERELMDKWLDEMDFTVKEVLEACRTSAGIREPNLRYVNKVLENKMLENGGIDTKTAAPSDSSGEEVKVSRKVLREYFDYLRETEEKEYRARIADARENIEGMNEVLTEISRLNSSLISQGMGTDSREKRQKLHDRRRALEEEKLSLLAQNGYPKNHLNKQYKCDICKDTGYTDEGRTCTCCKERAEEAYKWLKQIKNQ